jgi:HEAT repeat protein
MATARFLKAAAAVVLFNGVLYLSLPSEAQAGPERDAARYTAELKTAKDAKTKANALHELGKLAAIMKSYAAEALPDIYKSLDDKDASVRAAAAQALGACDEPADKAVPALLKLVKEDKDDSVKIGAVKGLGSMGPNAKSALGTLRELAADKKSKVGGAAKAAMKAIQIKGM